MLNRTYDLIIIGAGAAGLSAAIAYKRVCSGSVLLIEGNPEAGRKILATGNGKCNLSNTGAAAWKQTLEFFTSLGIVLDIEDEGRVYPRNRQASVVKDVLYETALELGAEFIFNRKAVSVNKKNNGFSVDTIQSVSKKTRQSSVAKCETPPGQRDGQSDNEALSFFAEQLIITTGGKAGPQYGSTGDGYNFAREFGLDVNTIRPGLVPLIYDDSVREKLAGLKGVRSRAAVRLLDPNEDDLLLSKSSGEVQFTDYGLSGICIFDLSLSVLPDKAYIVEIDFTYGIEPDVTMRDSKLDSINSLNHVAGLKGIVHEKLAEIIKPEQLTCWRIPVKGTKGWKEAQVTVGGVSKVHLNSSNEAADISGLYFAGEVLDYCGICGGYNLDHAWTSGINAGTSAADSIK